MLSDVSKLGQVINQVTRGLLRLGDIVTVLKLVHCKVPWGRGEVLRGAEDLSPRVQQAPKPGESLELPLGPPVRLKKASGVHCGREVV